MPETGTCYCGRETDYFGPDPYQLETNGDETPYWICDDCYYESSMDIWRGLNDDSFA